MLIFYSKQYSVQCRGCKQESKRPRAASNAVHLHFKMVGAGQGGKATHQDLYVGLGS